MRILPIHISEYQLPTKNIKDSIYNGYQFHEIYRPIYEVNDTLFLQVSGYTFFPFHSVSCPIVIVCIPALTPASLMEYVNFPPMWGVLSLVRLFKLICSAGETMNGLSKNTNVQIRCTDRLVIKEDCLNQKSFNTICR